MSDQEARQGTPLLNLPTMRPENGTPPPANTPPTLLTTTQDHHCPWLAACVGLYNYKPFLLFLIYTSIFCWHCFLVSGTWVWRVVLNDIHFQERIMPVNYILLTALGGIIGLVLSGFTGWHIYLALRNQTTIESLEKTRYLAPARASLQHHLEQRNPVSPSLTDHLREIHSNILPGVTRPEEGIATAHPRSPSPSTSTSTTAPSPAHASLRRAYASLEHSRERARHAAYLDEQDLDALPHAFDLGWRRNLRHLLGPRPLLWFLPVCNTTGDGWRWEASARWIEAREELARERERREREDAYFAEQRRGWQDGPVVDFRGGAGLADGVGPLQPPPRAPPRAPPQRQGDVATSQHSMRTLRPRSRSPAWRDGLDDGDGEGQGGAILPPPTGGGGAQTANWNDLPDDFLGPTGRIPVRKALRSRSRG